MQPQIEAASMHNAVNAFERFCRWGSWSALKSMEELSSPGWKDASVGCYSACNGGLPIGVAESRFG